MEVWSGEWWTTVAFSGIVGTVVGTLVAIGGVALTLKHNRRLFTEAAQVERDRQAEARFADACLRLLDRIEALLDQPRDEPLREGTMWRLRSETAHLYNRATARDKRLAQLLEMGLGTSGFTLDEDIEGRVQSHNAAVGLRSALRARLSDPNVFDDYPDWDDFMRVCEQSGSIPQFG